MNKTELKTRLGLKIKEYRNKMGFSQEELAEKIGRNQRQISLIELGKSFPNTDTLIELAEVFNCTIRDLFDFELIVDEKTLKDELIKMIEKTPISKLKILYLISKNI